MPSIFATHSLLQRGTSLAALRGISIRRRQLYLEDLHALSNAPTSHPVLLMSVPDFSAHRHW